MRAVQPEIEAFLRHRRIAAVGVSTRAADFSCAIVERLRAEGFEVFSVNPGFAGSEDPYRVASLRDIPEPTVDGVFLTTAPSQTEAVVRECRELGIARVWMHQNVGQGSTSPEAVAFCKEHGIAVIDRGCPMMFVGQVDWFHKTLRWLKGLAPVEGVSA